MELHELVERIQRWKARQAAEAGEEVATGEVAAAVPYAEDAGVAEAPVAEASAMEEYVEPVDEYEPVAEEAEAVAEIDAQDAVEEVADGDVETVEAEGEWEGDEETSEVDLDQIEDVEEV